MKKYILSFLTLFLSGLSSSLFAQEVEYSFDVKMQTNYNSTSNSIDFILKYPQFKEKIAIKLIYDPFQQPEYNGDNWIWYHSNPIHDFSFSLSNKTFSSGQKNSELDFGSLLKKGGNIRVCLVNSEGVFLCSKSSLSLSKFPKPTQIIPQETGNQTILFNLFNKILGFFQNFPIVGLFQITIGIGTIFLMYQIYRLYMFRRKKYLKLKNPLHILRIFRTGDEYRIELNDIYEKGIRVSEENRKNILSELHAYIRAMHLFSHVRGDGDIIETTQFQVPNLMKFGSTLYRLLLSDRIRNSLQNSSGSLIIRTDDQEIPWELLHTGSDFLALQRPLGREILMSTQARKNPPSTHNKHPKILCIYNPTEDLPGAQSEGDFLQAFLRPSANVHILSGKNATATEVFSALGTSGWDIIHYAGHAHFSKTNPQESGLILAGNQIISISEIQRILAGSPLVFLNACSSGKTLLSQEEHLGLEVMGIASAFMAGGAHGVISTLWPIQDEIAAEFSRLFYQNLLHGNSVGESILQAKRTLYTHEKTGISWASFALYGNPDIFLHQK